MNETVGLFKYLDASKLVFFENCLVLLTPPIYLNDPWDFFPKGRVPSEEEILKAWQEAENEITLSSVIVLPTDFAQRAQQDRLKRTRAKLTSKEFVAGQGPHFQNEIGKYYGIVSLTELPLSRLMWSHYAQSHQGFVAEFTADGEFDMDGLVVRPCALGPEGVTPAAKVKYTPDFRQLLDSENIPALCLLKHLCWENEKEWRIIWPLKQSVPCRVSSAEHCHPIERYCLPFNPKNLRRVIFGMRMKPGVRQRLCCMLDQEDFKHVRKETTEICEETGKLIVKTLS